MTTFPSIPGWDGLHPVMVHFPIALFLAAPVLLLISLLSRQAWRTWAWAALVLMLIGTVAAWLAVATGHAAGQLVDKTDVLAREILRHRALGVATRDLFTLLTVLFAGLLLLPRLLRRSLPTAARASLQALLLLACLAGTLVVGNAASRGGRLVHTLGVRAMLDPPVAPAGEAEDGVAAAPAADGKAASR